MIPSDTSVRLHCGGSRDWTGCRGDVRRRTMDNGLSTITPEGPSRNSMSFELQVSCNQPVE